LRRADQATNSTQTRPTVTSTAGKSKQFLEAEIAATSANRPSRQQITKKAEATKPVFGARNRRKNPARRSTSATRRPFTRALSLTSERSKKSRVRAYARPAPVAPTEGRGAESRDLSGNLAALQRRRPAWEMLGEHRSPSALPTGLEIELGAGDRPLGLSRGVVASILREIAVDRSAG